MRASQRALQERRRAEEAAAAAERKQAQPKAADVSSLHQVNGAAEWLSKRSVFADLHASRHKAEAADGDEPAEPGPSSPVARGTAAAEPEPELHQPEPELHQPEPEPEPVAVEGQGGHVARLEAALARERFLREIEVAALRRQLQSHHRFAT